MLWALFAAAMARNAFGDPYNPALEGTRRYGHNHEGALQDGLLFSLVELAVLYGVLQPWKTSGRLWLRGLGALALLVPWTLISGLFSMHAGGVVSIHLLWLLAIVLVVLIAVAISGIAAIARTRLATGTGATTPKPVRIETRKLGPAPSKSQGPPTSDYLLGRPYASEAHAYAYTIQPLAQPVRKGPYKDRQKLNSRSTASRASVRGS